MKISGFIALLLTSMLLSACSPQNSSRQAAKKTVTVKNGIEVIYFHAQHRCQACFDIEKYTKYTVQTYFTKNLQDNTITFRSLNIDNKENYAIADAYRAGGSALYLNVVRHGQSKKLNLTNFAFLNYTNKAAFVSGLKEKIEKELNTLKNENP